MNKILKKTLKWGGIIYACFASFLATLYILLIVYVTYINPPPKSNIYPDNGFKVVDSPSIYRGKIITDVEGNLVVHEYVTKVRWKDNIIYGERKGISRLERRPYYFVCIYGKDCLEGQHYNQQEFETLRVKYQLPDWWGKL